MIDYSPNLLHTVISVRVNIKERFKVIIKKNVMTTKYSQSWSNTYLEAGLLG